MDGRGIGLKGVDEAGEEGAAKSRDEPYGETPSAEDPRSSSRPYIVMMFSKSGAGFRDMARGWDDSETMGSASRVKPFVGRGGACRESPSGTGAASMCADE